MKASNKSIPSQGTKRQKLRFAREKKHDKVGLYMYTKQDLWEWEHSQSFSLVMYENGHIKKSAMGNNRA